MTYDWKDEMPGAAAERRGLRRHLRLAQAWLRILAYLRRQRVWLVMGAVAIALGVILGRGVVWNAVLLVVFLTVTWDMYEAKIAELEFRLALSKKHARRLSDALDVMIQEEWLRDNNLQNTPVVWMDDVAYVVDDSDG